jgi:pyrimidine operon attenuation protein/uracil phosphoribosyltransferase
MNETELQIKKFRQDLKAIDENKYLTEAYKVEARNQIKAQEKIYYERAVRAAIQAGFEDKVLGEDASDSTLSKAARYVRKGSL